MIFKNLSIYRVRSAAGSSVDSLSGQLAGFSLQPCASQDVQSRGWVSPRGDGQFIHAVNGQWLLALGVEQRILPASVVAQFARDKAQAIFEAEGRKVGRREMRELREDATRELLPRAFVRRLVTRAWIDPINGWLVIDSSSTARAEELMVHLRKTVDGLLRIELWKTAHAPSTAMTAWVAGNEAPAGFTLDQDLDLVSEQEALVRYVRHALDGEEIRGHIASGKHATRLAMTWNDRISFVLADTMQLKRLKFTDLLLVENRGQSENEQECFDLDFTLMTGEVARLLGDVVDALGGELS